MDGALIIDKPDGLTSHDVVARVRRAASTRRVGHAGTLDPFATGVLIVCVGRATRLVQFLVGLDKAYVARVKLGFSTDTQDLAGKPTSPLISSDWLSVDDVRRVLTEFRGPQLQLPPMYSAKKVGGERLHRAARAGRELDRQPVPIVVHSLRLRDADGPFFERMGDGTLEFVMEVECSSGTYIRTLAHDIGQRLGTGAHLVGLRRTRAGRFDISRAVPLDRVIEAGAGGSLEPLLVSCSEAVGHLPFLRLDWRDRVRVRHGLAVTSGLTGGESAEAAGRWVRLLDEAGALIAVGEIDSASGVIRPRVVLHERGQGEG